MKKLSTIKRTGIMIVLLFVFLSKNTAAQDLTFTSRTDFNAAVGASVLSENFDGFSDGQQVVNLFNGLVTFASPLPTVFFGNWNNFGTAGNFSGGAIIPEPRFQGKSLTLNFSAPVAGIGGNAFDDFDGSPFVNVITLTVTTTTGHILSVSENFGNVGDTGFLGATSSDGIVKAEFSIDNNDGNLEVELLTVAPVASNDCVPAPSGLVSWWPGENNANDIQSSNHGTLKNGATFTAGKVGQALSFDGVDDYTSVLDDISLQLPDNEFAISLWFKTASVTSSQMILSKGVSDANEEYSINLVQNAGIYWDYGDLQSFVFTSPVIVVPNQWYHLVVLYSSSFSPRGKVYLNSVEQPIAVSGFPQSHIVSSGSNLYIGAQNAGVPYYSGRASFNGLIDEVDIYNRALSASEIQSIYNAGSAGKCKECSPPEVSITGNESVCPHSIHTYTATTNATNPSFNWSVTGGTINGSNTGSSVSVTAGSTGTMIVSVEATDGTTNCSKSVTQNVAVKDNQAPVITAATNPITLWPPNHQYITINVSQCVASVTDNCATLSASNVVITKVTSDEPEDAKGGGDGNTLKDMVIASNCQSVQLRSEREGSGNGRVYTIHLSVSDGNGNTGPATRLVTVAKSQNGNSAVNDGPVYTVTGSCNGSLGKLAGLSSDENAETMTLLESYALEQNYPNPFNPSTVIGFQLPVNSEVKLVIYSITGQLVRELVNGEMNAGRHVISWDGRDRIGNTVAAGMYLYRLVAHGENGEIVFTETRRMALVK